MEPGTLYLATHRTAPDHNRFEGTAVSGDGTDVAPDAVALDRHWSVRAFDLADPLQVCVDLTDIRAVMQPEQLVLLRREGPGAPWIPLDSYLEERAEASYLCATNVATNAEIGIGGEDAVNPLPVEPGMPVLRPLTLETYPNPTREGSTVQLAVPANGVVTLEAFDVIGRRVTLLHEGPLPAGEHTFFFNAAQRPPGIYLLRARTAVGTVTGRLIVVR